MAGVERMKRVWVDWMMVAAVLMAFAAVLVAGPLLFESFLGGAR